MSGSDHISDAVVGDSAGGALADAIQASRRKKRNRESAFQSPTPDGICSNCETKLMGSVCHSCGQIADTYHRPVWELLQEVLDGLFGFEGRFWRTLPNLMLRPGKITRQYLSGIRARYVQPFRLYLTASVIFFLIVFSMDGLSGQALMDENGPVDAASIIEGMNEAVDREELVTQLAQSGLSEQQQALILDNFDHGAELVESGDVDELETTEVQQEGTRIGAIESIRQTLLPELYPSGNEGAQTDGAASPADLEGDIDLSGLTGLPLGLRQTLAEQSEKIIADNGQALFAEMRNWTPRLMFFMLPLYAFVLAITHFYKRGYFFYDHLVVSLHFHAFIFFLFIGLIAVGQVAGLAWALPIAFLWSHYYLYRLHRHVYSHGRISSVLRVLFLDVVYSLLMMIGFIALLVIGVMTV